MASTIGTSLIRREDGRFLRGTGQFTADLEAAGQLHAAFVRCPHAHARIRGIDASAALEMPGAVAFYTAADLQAEGVGPIPSYARTAPLAVPNVDGSEMFDASAYPLARDRARYTGEPVAVVLAETILGREIECAVLGNESPEASIPGEIVPRHEFYSYEAKYVDGTSEWIIPADLPDSVTAELLRQSIAACRALDDRTA